MSNFKSGSGNLPFGEEEEEDSDQSGTVSEADDSTPETQESAAEQDSSQSEGQEAPDASHDGSSVSEQLGGGSRSDQDQDYPYFVRRNNVTDERDVRLEIHVRPEVAEEEAAYRRELAEELDTDTVLKTDAREFALLLAYKHPKKVAQLMRDEGFGILD